MEDHKDANAIDEADLEDGEIESDEDSEIVEPAKEKIVRTESDTKKAKISSDEDVAPSKKASAKHSKGEHPHRKTNSKATNNGGNGGANSSSNKKNSSEPSSSARKPVDDDWAGNVENAIAMALKKDGLEPKTPKLGLKTSTKEQPPKVEATSGSSKSSKRRKHKNADKSPRKRQRKQDDDNDRLPASNDSEEFDDYEMMNVRGGSPPSHGGPQEGRGQSHKQGMLYYDSDGSYTSYDSYDSGEHRMRRQRGGKRRNHERNARGGNNRNKRSGRRRDDSEDEGGGGAGGGGGGGGGGHNNHAGGGGGGNRNNNNPALNGPRKAELCKFYLMECCAKREKCLYMHGDFPCKFYYLGMKNHNRENCKFSHGKPLTDQLRNVLLKHLETAPKEIIGDFPRISRENAINMINIQNQKLLVKFGMETEPQTATANASSATGTKLPSLLDLVTKFPSHGEHASNNSKKEKTRKSRWCDQRPNDGFSNYPDAGNSHMNPLPAALALPTQASPSSSQSNDNDLKLTAMTHILSPEQIQNLAKMGIESVSQITRLTVLQVMELGLSIAEITELQQSAFNLQKNKNLHTQSAPATATVAPPAAAAEPTAPTSPASSVEIRYEDQDMRIPLSTATTSKETKASATTAEALLNQDIDMRVLGIPRAAASPASVDANLQGDSNALSLRTFNTQFIKQADDQSNTIKSELPKIDYSQYLKDANLDLNHSDYEDQSGEDHSSKKRKINYESDEAEDSLVIEEEPLQIDESRCQTDEEDALAKAGKAKHSDSDHINQNRSDARSGLYDNEDSASNSGSIDSALSSQQTQSNADDVLLPAVYAPASIYPTSVTNKIDLSSSVSQYLNKSLNTVATAVAAAATDANKPADRNDSDDEHNDTFSSCRSPLASTVALDAHPTRNANFEFFTRQIPDSNPPVPLALDEKLSEYDSSGETASIPIASPPHKKANRKSIYEMSDTDDEDNEDSSNGVNIRTLSEDENELPITTSKDKDMRISSLFIDKDYSNGDIDLRLPFKPVMANYIPATEIDASITSHAPITYTVKEVEIPKPDYSELRRSIPSHEKTLDPRLRRILRLKEDSIDSENVLPASNTHTHASNEIEMFNPLLNPFSAAGNMASVQSAAAKTENVARARLDPRGDPRSDPRSDPRRQNAQMNAATGNAANAPVSVLNQQPSAQRSLHLDIQNILQKSNWYKDCSSKQKIMVNQQLAIVSTELKKFHADPSENKFFDLTFILQNQLLQEVLTNLGIFISDDGEFVQLDQSSSNSSNIDANRRPGANNVSLIMSDLMSLPIGSNLEMDFLRNQQQQQQQQQAAMQQAMNAIGGQTRFLGAPNAPPIIGFGNLQQDVVRPGLLGIAPNMPLPNQFTLFDAQQNVDPFFNRNVQPNSNNLDNRNNYRGGAGNRWLGSTGTGGGIGGGGVSGCNTGGNTNRDPSMRRNQYDRNNSRRDKK